MKKNKRKIFGIGSAVLMILLVFAPITNSLRTESGSDTELDIIIHRCEYMNFYPKSKQDDLEFDEVEYELEYDVRCRKGSIDYPLDIVFVTD